MSTYSVSDLGGVAVGGSCVPAAIAKVGPGWRVTGTTAVGSQSFSFLLGDHASLQLLPAPTGPSEGGGVGVNARGDVAGTFSAGGTPPVPARAFLRTHDGNTLDLQAQFLQALGAVGSSAVGLNGRAHPDVVGSFVDQNGNNHPWFFAGDTQHATDLTAALPGQAVVTGMNDARQLVGFTSYEQLFLYDFTTSAVTLISDFPGRHLDAPRVFINNAGQVLAHSIGSMFVRQPSGAYVSFGGPDGAAEGINDSGQVVLLDVVRSTTSPFLSDFFVTDPISVSASAAPAVREVNSLLTTPGWKVSRLCGIDGAGRIVALGQLNGGSARGVLLTPSPR